MIRVARISKEIPAPVFKPWFILVSLNWFKQWHKFGLNDPV